MKLLWGETQDFAASLLLVLTFIFIFLLFFIFFYKEARMKQPSFTAPQLQPWSSLSLVILLLFLFKNVTGGRTVGPYRLLSDQDQDQDQDLTSDTDAAAL